MSGEKRKAVRVPFARGIEARMISIDGTWVRPCVVKDASATGARLTVKGSCEGLSLREFFLSLCSTGQVYRRCQLIRVDGDEIGVRFLIQQIAGKPKRVRSR